jgi:hypothetical protein
MNARNIQYQGSNLTHPTQTLDSQPNSHTHPHTARTVTAVSAAAASVLVQPSVLRTVQQSRQHTSHACKREGEHHMINQYDDTRATWAHQSNMCVPFLQGDHWAALLVGAVAATPTATQTFPPPLPNPANHQDSLPRAFIPPLDVRLTQAHVLSSSSATQHPFQHPLYPSLPSQLQHSRAQTTAVVAEISSRRTKAEPNKYMAPNCH